MSFIGTSGTKIAEKRR